MERWRTVMPVLLAAVIAVAGSLLTYRWIKSQMARGPEVVTERVETVPIAVAKADLPWGKPSQMEPEPPVPRSTHRTVENA